ncbi:MAG: aminopeptidase [Clostridia bacterium]|nr:aminopeptidase [Clostridia bacterium]
MSQAKDLKQKLFNKFENGYKAMDEQALDACAAYAKGYIEFLDKNRTERECAVFAETVLRANGFEPVDEHRTEPYKAGDKIYKIQRNKAVIAAVIGKKELSEGVKIAAAHVDSPRLDLKPNPLYESENMAFFKTHYYGGIKKYQWTAIPLSLHGVICKADGEKLTVNIGDDPADPQFVVTDLLPHLATEQMKREARQIVKAEELNLLIGSVPFKDDEESELVKLNILNLLFEKYGICERDFLSAELCAIPAFPVREIGFDRSFIGGYGHDDKVCAYPALTALLECGVPENTCLAVWVDKEEIGSEGNTGMKCDFLRYFIADLARTVGLQGRDVIRNCSCISADVNAGFDPTFADVVDKYNCAYVNKGVCLTKYTGAGGKSGSNDASAEFIAYLRGIYDKAGVLWQIGELGKTDLGGGGTVAKYVANLDIETVDLGVPVLSMHAPFEIIGKIDLYNAHLAFKEYFKA